MNQDTHEIGILIECPDCECSPIPLLTSDMQVVLQCPVCGEEVYPPNPETLGFH